MIERIPFHGELLSLLTAFAWAWAVILFKKSGERVHPLALGLFKNTMGMVLFPLTMLLVGQPLGHAAPGLHQIMLIASGALGIGIADTLFFACLNRLGAGRAAIVSCLYSPFIIALSIPFLGESLAALQLVGAIAIALAVVIGTWRGDRRAKDGGHILQGVILGIISMACNALGIVMIKPLLAHSPILWVTQMRLVGGAVVLAAGILARRDRAVVATSLYRGGNIRYTVAASFVGGYVSMILWLAGMKFTLASVASALNETSTIFIFLLSAVFLHEPITSRRMAGIALGFAGALLVTFGR
ncbi:DMT family transporter [Candidatus Fermentibacteria bacterium]|nr:DMT family transporter [Candidatus Fermentibacteria bacterium]